MLFAFGILTLCLNIYLAYRASLIFDDENESVKVFGKAFMFNIYYSAILYFDKSFFNSLPDSKQEKVRNLFYAYALSSAVILMIILILIAL
jgi:hypothetical protein